MCVSTMYQPNVVGLYKYTLNSSLFLPSLPHPQTHRGHLPIRHHPSHKDGIAQPGQEHPHSMHLGPGPQTPLPIEPIRLKQKPQHGHTRCYEPP